MCIHKAEMNGKRDKQHQQPSQQQHPSQAAGWEMKWEKVHFSMFSKALKPKLIDIKISHEHTPANIFIYISVNFPHLSEISDGLCCVCMLTPSRLGWRGLIFTLFFFFFATLELSCCCCLMEWDLLGQNVWNWAQQQGEIYNNVYGWSELYLVN